MHPFMAKIVLRMTDTRSTHLDTLSYPLHARALEPSESSRRKRRAVVAMNPIGNTIFSEDSSNARNDTIGTNRVLTIHAKHKASAISLKQRDFYERWSLHLRALPRQTPTLIARNQVKIPIPRPSAISTF